MPRLIADRSGLKQASGFGGDQLKQIKRNSRQNGVLRGGSIATFPKINRRLIFVAALVA